MMNKQNNEKRKKDNRHNDLQTTATKTTDRATGTPQ
jgi:hypothetical protein